jgi:hypothetical protein
MTDKPVEYYQEWAARLATLARDDGDEPAFTPEFVTDAERLSGKPIAEMTVEDWKTVQAQTAVTISLDKMVMRALMVIAERPALLHPALLNATHASDLPATPTGT